MNITVLAVGTKMPRWVDEAVGEYAKRFGRDVAYTLKEIKPEKRGAGVNAAQGMAAEEKRILEAMPADAFLVVLDERGVAPTSQELAGYLKKWQPEKSLFDNGMQAHIYIAASGVGIGADFVRAGDEFLCVFFADAGHSDGSPFTALLHPDTL